MLGSIFYLDIYSYSSDLLRYADPSFIDYRISSISQDFLFLEYLILFIASLIMGK